MRKALIVVPSFAGVEPRPLESFMQIAIAAGRTCPDWRFGVIAPRRQSLPMAMNNAAKTVMEQKFDALIAFDDDCFPPFDCIPRLIAHFEAGREFVAGVGVMRGYPHTTTVARQFPEGHSLVQKGSQIEIRGHEWLDDVDALPELAEVDFCGVPVALMARSIFEKVEPPFFGLHGEDGGVVTHDVFFCRKLKEAGIPVLVDTTIKCGHLSEAPIITFENRAIARELVGG